MGESWSDLDALEYLHEYNFVPTDGENDWAVGPYVTGNKERGIRNYALNDNPLNYSDVGYDLPGPEVHADGEIWNAVNYDIRKALVTKYNGSYPSTNARCSALRRGRELPADQCPGNRRWIQIVYDALLLRCRRRACSTRATPISRQTSMRFGGANQAEIWNAFARRGFGESASTASTDDDQPKPAFDSPFANEGSVTIHPRGTDEVDAVVGSSTSARYQARATRSATATRARRARRP